MYKNIPAYALIPAVEQPDAAVSAAENAVMFGEMPLDTLPLAICYVPMQQFGETYDGLTALQRGTIFPDLDLPFCGRGVK